MAKQRAAHKQRRNKKKVVSLHRSSQRRSSQKKENQVRHAAYRRTELEPGLSALARDNASLSAGNNAGENVRNLGAALANQLFEKALENYGQSLTMPSQQGHQVEPTSWMMTPARHTSVLRDGMQALMREFLNQLARQVQHHLKAMNALVRCRSPQDIIRVQVDLFFDTLESIIQLASHSSLAAIQMSTASARLNQLGRSG